MINRKCNVVGDINVCQNGITSKINMLRPELDVDLKLAHATQFKVPLNVAPFVCGRQNYSVFKATYAIHNNC